MHTQRTLAARTLRRGYVHNARWAPCRGSVVARTQQCRCSPWSRYKIVSQHNFLPRAMSRVLPRVSQRPCAVSQGVGRRIAAPLRRVVRRWVSYRSLYRCPYHDTKVAPKPRYKPLYRDLPLVRPCRRPILAVSQGCIASGAGNRVGRAWLGWAGPTVGRAKIGPNFSGHNFSNPARPRNRASRAK